MESKSIVAYAFAAVLPLLLLLRDTLAVAPGDEYDGCEVPDYPVNIKVLMDSWRYQTLLGENDATSDNTTAVWTTDNTEGSGSGYIWYSTSGVCENSAVDLCSGEPGEKWLKTQLINKSLPATDEYPVRVFVNITYSMTCSNVTDCESDIELQVRLNNTNQTLMPHAGDYTIPDNHTLDTAASGTQQFYFDLNKGVNMTLFVLTLISHSNDTCVNVSRVLVYRHECPQLSIGLTRHPAIQAPISGAFSIIPCCTKNSHLSSQGRSVPQCTSEGKWSANDYEYCLCNMEYFREDDVCILKAMFTPDMEVYTVMETQKERKICFTASKATHLMMPLEIVTHDGTAIGNFDFVPVNETVSFENELSQCVDILIVNDELVEGNESFTVDLMRGNETVSSVHVVISSDTGHMSCTEDSVTVVSDVYDNSLQLVEMCSSEGVWSPVCDYNWTLQDATVVCRELGYTSLGMMEVLDSAEGSPHRSDMIPDCNGTETDLISCFSPNTLNITCDYLLVECRDPVSTEPIATTATTATEATEATDSESDGGVSVAVFAGIGGAIGVVCVLVIVAVILIVVLMRRNRSGKHVICDERKDQDHGLNNPVYDPTAIEMKKPRDTDVHDSGEKDNEPSHKFLNPLYSPISLSSEVPANIYNFDDPNYAAPTNDNRVSECKKSGFPENQASGDERVPSNVCFDDPTYAAPAVDNSVPPESKASGDDRTPPPGSKPSSGDAPRESSQPPLVYDYVQVPICTSPRHEYHYLECPVTPSESGAVEDEDLQ